jgi:hypothetical protein
MLTPPSGPAGARSNNAKEVRCCSTHSQQVSCMQLPAFDEGKYKFFDVDWNTPMNTISGLTEWSRDINSVYGITTVIVTFVFIAVAIPLVLTLVKFKQKPGDDSPPKQFHGNATLEVLWTVIPVVLLLFIAVPTWRVLFKHAHKAENSLEIEAIGHQWWEDAQPNP